MAFRACFLDALQQVDSEFDMIAICYLELLFYVDDYDMSFISAQVQVRSTEEAFKTINDDLRKSILLSLQQGELTGDTVLGHSCTGFIGKLREMDPPDSDLPIYIFRIICVLDGYVKSNLTESDEYPSSKCVSGPLNCGDSLKQCLVYLKSPSSLMRESRKKFRHPLISDRIGSLMSNVLLIELNKLLRKGQEPPRIVHITPPENLRKALLEQKIIKIVSIPYIGFRTIQFHVLGKAEPCKSDDEIDGPFYVEYPSEEEEAGVDRILALLKLAIQDGAHIIIFPEFIMSGKMKDALQEYLRTVSSTDRNNLLLVLAGTCFHREGENIFHNILHLFDANGLEIGSCYKFSSFRLDSVVTTQDDAFEQSEFFQCCELLSSPGKECTLVDIDGIGRILPLICRDVTDGTRLRLLSDAFDPDIILIPAWSRSVSTFRNQLEEQANTHLIGSLLCNCCNAVLDKNETSTKTGLLCLPHKTGSVMEAAFRFIERPSGCAAACRSRGGCIVPIAIDFSQAQPVGCIEAHCSPNHR